MIGQRDVRADLRSLIIEELDRLNSQSTAGCERWSSRNKFFQYPPTQEQRFQSWFLDVIRHNYLKFLREMYPDAILDSWHEFPGVTQEELNTIEDKNLTVREKNKMILSKVESMPIAMYKPFLKSLQHARNDDLADLLSHPMEDKVGHFNHFSPGIALPRMQPFSFQMQHSNFSRSPPWYHSAPPSLDLARRQHSCNMLL